MNATHNLNIPTEWAVDHETTEILPVPEAGHSWEPSDAQRSAIAVCMEYLEQCASELNAANSDRLQYDRTQVKLQFSRPTSGRIMGHVTGWFVPVPWTGNPLYTIWNRCYRLIQQDTTRHGTDTEDDETRRAKYRSLELAQQTMPDCLSAVWTYFTTSIQHGNNSGFPIPNRHNRDVRVQDVYRLFWRIMNYCCSKVIIEFVRHGGVVTLTDKQTTDLHGQPVVWFVRDQLQHASNAIDADESVRFWGSIDLQDYLETLKNRERAATELLIAGYGRNHICGELGLSEHTVTRLKKRLIEAITQRR